MGVRKWMTFNRRMRRMLSSVLRGTGGGALVLIVCAQPAIAETKAFDLMVTPGIVIPAGDGLFLPAPASSLVLDFLPRKNLALFLQGEFESVTVRSVDPIQLYDGSAGLGYVHPLNERLSLRGDLFAGVYAARRSSDQAPINLSGLSAGTRGTVLWRFSPSLAAGLHASLRHFAYMPEPFLTGFEAGLSVVLNLTEFFARTPRIEAQTVRQDPVFPVFYSYYDDHDFATVRLTNREDAAITDISASFYLEQYMSQPGQCGSVQRLAPGAHADIPITAFFESSMLESGEKSDAEAKLTVRYRYLGSWRETQIPMRIPVYHRNAMSWDEDRRAAAFVSSRDPAALWFAKYVSSAVNGDFRNGINRNLQYAMGIFDSLKNYGLSYIVDPASAYAENAGSATSVDFLQYPYQTLMYRGGDCDDISILWCSLLESIDIESAFITIPGHIYAAFSAGVSEDEAKRTFSDPSLLIFRDGKAWIPVEITLTQEDFNKAWRIGAKEWRDAESRESAKLYPLREAWTLFPPVSVPGAASRFSLPDEKRTVASFNATLNAFIARELKGQTDALKRRIAQKDTAALRNELGILYARYGMIDQARSEFERAKTLGGTYAAVNLGNLSFLSGDYETALGTYTTVLEKEQENKLAILGAARCCYELGDFETSDGLFGMLSQMDGQLAKDYSYLNSFFDTTGRAWSLSERLETTLWSVPPGKDGFFVAGLQSDKTSSQTEGGSKPSGLGSTGPSVRDLTALSSQEETVVDVPLVETESLPPTPEPAVIAKAEIPKETAPAVIPELRPAAAPQPVAAPEAETKIEAAPELPPAPISAAEDTPAALEPELKPVTAVEPTAESDSVSPTSEPVLADASTAEAMVEITVSAETEAADLAPEAQPEPSPAPEAAAPLETVPSLTIESEPVMVTEGEIEAPLETVREVEADTEPELAQVLDSSEEPEREAPQETLANLEPMPAPPPAAAAVPRTGLTGQLNIDQTGKGTENALARLLADAQQKAAAAVKEQPAPVPAEKTPDPVPETKNEPPAPQILGEKIEPEPLAKPASEIVIEAEPVPEIEVVAAIESPPLAEIASEPEAVPESAEEPLAENLPTVEAIIAAPVGPALALLPAQSAQMPPRAETESARGEKPQEKAPDEPVITAEVEAAETAAPPPLSGNPPEEVNGPEPEALTLIETNITSVPEIAPAFIPEEQAPLTLIPEPEIPAKLEPEIPAQAKPAIPAKPAPAIAVETKPIVELASSEPLLESISVPEFSKGSEPTKMSPESKPLSRLLGIIAAAAVALTALGGLANLVFKARARTSQKRDRKDTP